MINRDTKVCISISTNPGSTGAKIHNALYERHRLDYVYIPRYVHEGRLAGAVAGLRSLEIEGCSVSMPFKERVIPFLDKLVGDARDLGVVNTIRREGELLVGYNTDVYGAMCCLDRFYTATIMGAGATARSVALAMVNLGYDEINIWNRTYDKAVKLAEFVEGQGKRCRVIDSTDYLHGEVLVNATSAGMGNEVLPVSGNVISGFKAVFDVVNMPSTDLRRRTLDIGPEYISGQEMAIYQALKQFELYTWKTLDIPVEAKFVRELL